MFTIMTYDVDTIDDLISLFGGPTKLGQELGIGDNAICNWSARGFIPPSWHLRLYVDLRRLGKTANPELFEMPPESGRVLFPRGKSVEHVAA